MRENKLQGYFFLSILLIVLTLAAWIIWPYVTIIVLAGTLAVIFYPLYQKIQKALKNEFLSAIISVLFVGLVVLVPLSLFGFQIIREARDLYTQVMSGPDSLIRAIEKQIQRLLPNFSWDLESYLKQAFGWLAGHLGVIFSSLSQALINLTLGLVTLFYFFRDGKRIQQALIAISPFQDRYDKDILSHLKIAVNSVVKGSIFSAILQGALIGLGFKIFGLPNPALWGVAVFFASLIPGIGLALVLIPSAAYLFITNDGLSALGLLIWGITINLCLDNLVTPQLLRRGMNIHPLLVLFAVLGGMAAFGAIGLLMGPIILSLLIALLKIYPELILDKAE